MKSRLRRSPRSHPEPVRRRTRGPRDARLTIRLRECWGAPSGAEPTILAPRTAVAAKLGTRAGLCSLRPHRRNRGGCDTTGRPVAVRADAKPRFGDDDVAIDRDALPTRLQR